MLMVRRAALLALALAVLSLSLARLYDVQLRQATKAVTKTAEAVGRLTEADHLEARGAGSPPLTAVDEVVALAYTVARQVFPLLLVIFLPVVTPRVVACHDGSTPKSRRATCLGGAGRLGPG